MSNPNTNIATLIQNKINNEITMYSVIITYGDRCFHFDDLSSDKDLVEGFVSRLNSNDFPYFVIDELIEDFLAELYGMWS